MDRTPLRFIRPRRSSPCNFCGRRVCSAALVDGGGNNDAILDKYWRSRNESGSIVLQWDRCEFLLPAYTGYILIDIYDS